MTTQEPTPPKRSLRRICGLVALGAWFGAVSGIVFGFEFPFYAGFGAIDSVIGSVLGGLPGGALAMLIVGVLGGRKCRQIDQMHSAAFSGCFGAILGGMAGIGLLELLRRESGEVHRIGEDLMVISFAMSAVASITTWIVSHLSKNERRLQFAVLAMFLMSVGCCFITPAALPFGIAGAVAGTLSQWVLVERVAP